MGALKTDMEKRLRILLGPTTFGNVSAQRSKVMASVKAKGNKATEERLRMALVRLGTSGWFMHSDQIGKPDFYFRRQRLAIFVDGCFWHGCPKCGHTPRTNSRYWHEKIEGNRRRDRRTNQMLRHKGIRVLRFWEHELSKRLGLCTQKVLSELQRV
jgi:DNA mismatch endonuclease (patch repair protein)